MPASRTGNRRLAISRIRVLNRRTRIRNALVILNDFTRRASIGNTRIVDTMVTSRAINILTADATLHPSASRTNANTTHQSHAAGTFRNRQSWRTRTRITLYAGLLAIRTFISNRRARNGIVCTSAKINALPCSQLTMIRCRRAISYLFPNAVISGGGRRSTRPGNSNARNTRIRSNTRARNRIPILARRTNTSI